MVIHTLAGEFDIYKEENGESIPVPCDDASNGFLKPKSGEWHHDVPEATLSPGGTVPEGRSFADTPVFWGPLFLASCGAPEDAAGPGGHVVALRCCPQRHR